MVDPDADTVLNGAKVLRSLRRRHDVPHVESPNSKLARATMQQPGWMRRLVLSVIAMLNIVKNEVFERTPGVRDAMLYLVSADEIYAEIEKIKDLVVDDLLYYLKNGKTELAAQLLQAGKEKYLFDFEIVDSIDSDLRNGQILNVHLVLLDIVPPIYEELYLKLCKVIYEKTKGRFQDDELVLALDLWMKVYKKFQYGAVKLGKYTSADFIIRYLTNFRYRRSTPLIHSSHSPICERVFMFLKLLSPERSPFLNNNERNEIDRKNIFKAINSQLTHFRSANHLIALDYLIHLKMEAFRNNNHFLRDYLSGVLKFLLQDKKKFMYALKLNVAKGRRMMTFSNNKIEELWTYFHGAPTFGKLLMIARNTYNEDSFNIGEYRRTAYGLKYRGFKVPEEQMITTSQMRSLLDRDENHFMYRPLELFKKIDWTFDTLPDVLNWTNAFYREIGEGRLNCDIVINGVMKMDCNHNYSARDFLPIALMMLHKVLDPESRLLVHPSEMEFLELWKKRCPVPLVRKLRDEKTPKFFEIVNLLVENIFYTLPYLLNVYLTVRQISRRAYLCLKILADIHPIAGLRLSTIINRNSLSLTFVNSSPEQIEQIQNQWDCDGNDEIRRLNRYIPNIDTCIKEAEERKRDRWELNEKKKRMTPEEKKKCGKTESGCGEEYLLEAEFFQAAHRDNLFGANEFIDWLIVRKYLHERNEDSLVLIYPVYPVERFVHQ